MRHIGALADAIVTSDGAAAALRLLPFLGFADSGTVVTRYARPIRWHTHPDRRGRPLLAAALQRCGFIARSSRPLLVRANGVRLPAAGIRIQMLDDDTAYRHGGSRTFWV